MISVFNLLIQKFSTVHYKILYEIKEDLQNPFAPVSFLLAFSISFLTIIQNTHAISIVHADHIPLLEGQDR